MYKRVLAIVLVILALPMQAFMIIALGNAKIVTLFGAEIGVIATDDLYASLVSAIITFLILLALFVVVIKSRSEEKIEDQIREKYNDSLKDRKLVAWQDGYAEGHKEGDRAAKWAAGEEQRRDLSSRGEIKAPRKESPNFCERCGGIMRHLSSIEGDDIRRSSYKCDGCGYIESFEEGAPPAELFPQPVILKSPSGSITVSPPDGTVAAAKEGIKAFREFTYPESLPTIRPRIDSVVPCPKCGKRLRELVSLSNPDNDKSLYCVECGFTAPIEEFK